MKLYRVKAFGDLSGLRPAAEPDPAAPTGRQVLVRVRASSLNQRDLMDLRGHLQGIGPGMAADHIPLSDGAGELLAVGPEVTRARVGDRVALSFYPAWIGGRYEPTMGVIGRSSERDDGMLTELKLVDENEVVPLPAHLSYEEGATLPCAALTAWSALHGPVPLLTGESVLVMGSGGVSVFALQFAKAAGAYVIATTTTGAKKSRLQALGADVVIDASDGAAWHTQVLAATGGMGADVIVEMGGAGTWPQSIQATRIGGRMSLVGALSGSLQGMPSHFLMRGLSLHPIRVGSRQDFEQMNRAVSVHRLRPVIDRVFDFDEAPAALQYFATGQHVGKVVIRHA